MAVIFSAGLICCVNMFPDKHRHFWLSLFSHKNCKSKWEEEQEVSEQAASFFDSNIYTHRLVCVYFCYSYHQNQNTCCLLRFSSCFLDVNVFFVCLTYPRVFQELLKRWRPNTSSFSALADIMHDVTGWGGAYLSCCVFCQLCACVIKLGFINVRQTHTTVWRVRVRSNNMAFLLQISDSFCICTTEVTSNDERICCLLVTDAAVQLSDCYYNKISFTATSEFWHTDIKRCTPLCISTLLTLLHRPDTEQSLQIDSLWLIN